MKRATLDEVHVDWEMLAGRVAGVWPPEWVTPTTFVAYVSERIDPDVPADVALAELHVSDLYLACAVGQGVAAAITALDEIITRDLPAVIASVDSRPATIDDLLQQMRERVLVPASPDARLPTYSGHGPLKAWLRVSALRSALMLKRRDKPQVAADEDLAELFDLAPNTEMRVLAHQLGGDLKQAIARAIAAQPARTRSTLRMYYADHRGIDDIGRVYGVHASTVSRWLAKARADILERTRGELAERLHLPGSQLDSLLGHAASLEIGLDSVLRSRPI